MSLPQVAKNLDLQQALAARGLQCGMSRKGNCWDNAVVESFFSSLKLELGALPEELAA